MRLSKFQNSAERFLKDGVYCPFPEQSSDWWDFWNEEKKRILEGYEVDSVKITGEHYFYLNYTQILKVNKQSHRFGKKIISFPDFWDGDYNYFWAREIARRGIVSLLSNKEQEKFYKFEYEKQLAKAKALFDSLNLIIKIDDKHLLGGYNIIIAKSRRKGYSYKSASCGVRNLVMFPRSITIYNAFEQKYLFPSGVFGMAKQMINFISSHTPFVVYSDVVNRVNHVKNSYISYEGGVRIERGLKSEIMAFSINLSADVNRGKDALDIFIEEAGAFGTPGLLKKLYFASEDTVQAGTIKTGMITIFGTSGDMDSGSVDFSDMFSRPEAFNLLPLRNIWDEGMEDSYCGFFHPVSWNMEGFYDKEGKSDIEGAREYELNERKKLITSGASVEEINKRKQEKPLSPMEAFSISKNNIFPVSELNIVLAKLNSKKDKEGIPVQFKYVEGELKAIPILDNKVIPITSYKNLPDNIEGVPVIYEFPISGAPKNSYIVGYDPVRHDKGTSLASIIVYKKHILGNNSHDIIVAEYIGRKKTAEEIDEIAMLFAELYNCKVMYENEIPNTLSFFKRRRKLHLLYSQPNAVIKSFVKKSSVNRIYGTHITKALKVAGISYIRDWLVEVNNYDEQGNEIRNMDLIKSKRFLEELIYYNNTGNFDYISAFIMVMFAYHNELILNSNNSNEQKKKIANQLLEIYNIK